MIREERKLGGKYSVSHIYIIEIRLCVACQHFNKKKIVRNVIALSGKEGEERYKQLTQIVVHFSKLKRPFLYQMPGILKTLLCCKQNK